MSTDNFRQPKEKPTPEDPAKDKKEGEGQVEEKEKPGKKRDKKEGEEQVEGKEKPGKKRDLGKGGNKLPAVPESVLKSRKRRDLAKATRSKAALKVISYTFHIVADLPNVS